MVVRYILVGDHGLHQREEVGAAIKGRQLRRQVDHTGGCFRHVGGQIPAVRAGIGQQLLFVEALGVVKGLLRRVSEQAVRFTLQGGKIIELRRLLLFLLLRDGSTGDGHTLAHSRCLFRLRRISEGKRLKAKGRKSVDAVAVAHNCNLIHTSPLPFPGWILPEGG